MTPKHVTGLFLVVLLTGTILGWAEPVAGPKQSFRDPLAKELRPAIAASDLDTVQRIVSAAQPDDCLEVDEQGRTALHDAVRKCASDNAGSNAFAVLKLLASRKPCVNAADRLGRKAILDLE